MAEPDAGFRAVLDFWFGAAESAQRGRHRDVWFRKDAAFDAQIRDRFLALHETAASGALDAWEQQPESALALTVVLDQFPRNMFRGTPRAFAADALALQVARRAVERGFDQRLLPVERCFLYLPFEHSENIADQQRSVELFESLSGDADSRGNIDYAHRHQAVIARFGRFPHRNAILGRESTPEELVFLQQPGSSF